MTIAELIRSAEAARTAARRAAERAKAAADGAPADLDLRYAAEDAADVHREAGRRLKALREDEAAEAEIDRRSRITASYYDSTARSWRETAAGWRERLATGLPLPEHVAAFDAA